ncbi:hypothetical protein LTR56_009813 [Elasticomyces elasticus]|nr:hypothetical protein LTR56_009813 [Elasticomyces elasticus]KAK3659128.1 hypothetical protein LTR22_008591 [Elasticomyces elasticus]KAK4923194.1 hypothetical protein LTR49_009662 [Elasticomyces elasticus]KAK5761578.1 hypothetical protein LTS12_008370 [Elasticomyces elasticus]
MKTSFAFLLPCLSAALDPRCSQFAIDVTTNATNHAYGLTGIDNDINIVSFVLDLSRWATINQTGPSPPNLPVSGTFRIDVQLCVPPRGGGRSNTLHLLTHGLLADKQYWDVQEEQAGYSTLSYDRLGTGLSDKPNASTVVQAPLQVEILRAITDTALRGTLSPAVDRSPGSYSPPASGPIQPFKHIVHIGHSYGSFITSAFIGSYGELSSAAIVTGYIPNSKMGLFSLARFGLDYAPTNNPELYGDRTSGYVHHLAIYQSAGDFAD